MAFFVVIIGFCLSYAFIRSIFSIFRVGKPNNLPPGPTTLPFIGNLHLLGDQPHQSLAKLAEIHGPIMSLKLGQITTVVISSAIVAKEVLQKQDLAFSDRYVPDALHAQNHYKFAVSFLPFGNDWRTLRRILNVNVFSGKCLEANEYLRMQKVKELVEYCRKAGMSYDSVDIGRAAFRTSLNVISNTIFSKDVTDPYEDSAKEFKELVGNIMMEIGKPNLVDFFPVLKKIDPQGIRRRLTSYFGKVLEIFDELIKERLGMKKLEKDDVLDVCLRINKDNPDMFSLSHMKMLFFDMFLAGSDTTSSTIEWAMAELIRQPHTITKAKEELEKVIGKGKIVNDDDVCCLPYLSCIVKETLRLHPAVPLLLPRKTKNQVEVNGYTIPQGAQVLVNVWAIGRDTTIWEDPQEFKPERFLKSQIDVRGQDFELLPFGGGRRICPGMPLALRTIPAMLGSLLNIFDWKLDMRIQPKELDMTERFGITIQKSKPLYVVPIPLN